MPIVKHIEWQSSPTAHVFLPKDSAGHLIFSERFFADYWAEKPLLSPKSHAVLDPWNVTLECLEVNVMQNAAYVFVGGKSISFNFTLKPNQSFQYSLSDLGIPADSKVVYVNYTPNSGGLFPAEMTGNVANTRRRFDPVTVVGGPLGKNTIPEDTEVCGMLTYLPPFTDVVDFQLAEAAEHFSHEQHENCLIPSHTAFEISLSRLIDLYLAPRVEKASAKNFSRIAFEHKLKVMLPLIAQSTKAKLLDGKILAALHELQRERNRVAHTGKMTKKLTSKEAARMLAGALFGVSYTRHLEARLQLTP